MACGANFSIPQVISETTEALKLTTHKSVDQENSLLEESLGCQTNVKRKLEDFEMLKVLGKGTFGKVSRQIHSFKLKLKSAFITLVVK